MRRFLFVFLGLLLFAIVLRRVDLAQTRELLAATRLWPLTLGFAAACAMTVVKGLRFSRMLALQGTPYSFWKSTAVYFISLFWGNITPGRMGDFVKVLYLRRDLKQSAPFALAVVFVDRVLDLYLLLALGCIGILIYPMNVDPKLLEAVWIFFIVLVAISFLAFHKKLGAMILKWVFQRFMGDALKEKSDRAFQEFHEGLRKLWRPKLFEAVFLSALAYAVFFGGCFQFAVALDIPLSLYYLAFCVAVANIVSLTTFAGVGTREGAFVVLFSLAGRSREEALAYSLLFFFGAGVLITLVGALFFLKDPMRLNTEG